MLKLVQATVEDAKELHKLQIEAFMPLYEKYQDDETSPAKETVERVHHRIEDVNTEYYKIQWQEVVIGGIRVRTQHSEEAPEQIVRWISPLFIIPKYQNKGIAQKVIGNVFDKYPDTVMWKLDTIKQEAGNCHLYEKMGFRRDGEERIVNERMTLVDYERICE